MILPINCNEQSYDIVIERGSLKKIKELLDLNRKVLIVTDSGVPSCYSKMVKNASLEGYVFTFGQGEESKNFDNFKEILSALTKYNFTRTDCVVAVGGGVCGDMAGFAASVFMRGIDFYNIPTTLLSQVDSSIGGKTAIDFKNVKNVVGTFYQPKKVIIDPDTLNTLNDRLLHEGLVEAIKMAATFDKELFSFIEQCDDLRNNLEPIIIGALKIKKMVVENDVKEQGLRKVLNFGHTIGHAIEAGSKGEFYHGEAVGIGMLYFSDDKVNNRIYNVLKKYHLPTSHHVPKDELISFIMHDKKKSGNLISIIEVEEIGSFKIEKVDIGSLKSILERNSCYEK